MSVGEISLEFLSRQQQQLLSELSSLRQESRQVRAAFSTIADYVSRLNKRIDDLERRLIDMREETEAIIKLEIGGSIANLETRLSEHSDRHFDRLLQLLNERLPETTPRPADR